MLADMFPQQLPRLSDVVTLGQRPGDDQRIRDQKAVCTCLLLLVLATGAFYVTVSDGPPFQRGLEASLMLLECVGLAVLWWTGSVRKLFYAYIPLYLLSISVLLLVFGTAEGDFVGFIGVPCAAIVLLGVRESWPWFLICLAAMVTLPIIDPLIPDIRHPGFVSVNNPLGSIFDAPDKKPIDPIEGFSLGGIVAVIYFLFRAFNVQLSRARHAVETEKAKVDRLMASIYPASVAAQLKEDSAAQIAMQHPSVTILFADVVGFTPIAAQQDAAALVDTLNDIFSHIDQLAGQFGVEKIKTIGDAYMGACGLNDDGRDHLQRAARFALALVESSDALQRPGAAPIQLRVGLHTGPVTAGVLGRTRPHYDIWGNTVNIAARLETSGAAGQVQILADIAAELGPGFTTSAPRQVDFKGLGPRQVVTLTSAARAQRPFPPLSPAD
ncbi:adenylate/guanylate cyclase domain-containing protein [Aliishimia ponticola]|nr:adenylate/guanylate cyclase domain-containing protein [Aliishimia ponticola]